MFAYADTFFNANLAPLNQSTGSMCVKCVDRVKCRKCQSKKIVRNGKNRNGGQRYLCSDCKLSFQTQYKYQSCITNDYQIVQLTKEGCGIRSTARILNVSPKTVLRRIIKIAGNIQRPDPIPKGKTYEVDEMFTYLKHKDNRICIAYSFEIGSGNVIDFVVGRRNKINLRKVTDTLILADAVKITTDKLGIYKDLIPGKIHSTKFRGINHIERKNLSLRTHLKRLNRKTICYSKSLAVLTAIVKIYFWS